MESTGAAHRRRLSEQAVKWAQAWPDADSVADAFIAMWAGFEPLTADL